MKIGLLFLLVLLLAFNRAECRRPKDRRNKKKKEKKAGARNRLKDLLKSNRLNSGDTPTAPLPTEREQTMWDRYEKFNCLVNFPTYPKADVSFHEENRKELSSKYMETRAYGRRISAEAEFQRAVSGKWSSENDEWYNTELRKVHHEGVLGTMGDVWTKLMQGLTVYEQYGFERWNLEKHQTLIKQREGLREKFEFLYSFLTHPKSLLGNQMRNRDMINLHYKTTFIRGWTSATTTTTEGHPNLLYPDDLNLLMKLRGFSLRDQEDVCVSKFIACAMREKELRVVGVDMHILYNTNDDSSTYRNTLILEEKMLLLRELPWLDTLWTAYETSTDDQSQLDIEGKRWCKALEALPKLRVLNTKFQLPSDCSLIALKSLVLNKRNRAKFWKPTEYDWVCNSPLLQSFESDSTYALAECLGRSTDLLRIDVRGGQFGTAKTKVGVDPIPAALSSLKNLVIFVAFEMNKFKCPPPDHQARSRKAGTGPCQPTYLWKGMIATPEPPWQCPFAGWRPKFDDMTQPWWSWTSIEKFWVDANFFHGSIPSEIADRWPNLRTLDLYDNDLTGVIPKEIGQLSQLHQLLLQDNRFSGNIPFNEILKLPKLMSMNVGTNPELHGCIVKKQLFDHPSLQLEDFYISAAKHIVVRSTSQECEILQRRQSEGGTARAPFDYDAELRETMRVPRTTVNARMNNNKKKKKKKTRLQLFKEKRRGGQPKFACMDRNGVIDYSLKTKEACEAAVDVATPIPGQSVNRVNRGSEEMYDDDDDEMYDDDDEMYDDDDGDYLDKKASQTLPSQRSDADVAHDDDREAFARALGDLADAEEDDEREL
jgi:hypothetical protein